MTPMAKGLYWARPKDGSYGWEIRRVDHRDICRDRLSRDPVHHMDRRRCRDVQTQLEILTGDAHVLLECRILRPLRGQVILPVIESGGSSGAAGFSSGYYRRSVVNLDKLDAIR